MSLQLTNGENRNNCEEHVPSRSALYTVIQYADFQTDIVLYNGENMYHVLCSAIRYNYQLLQERIWPTDLTITVQI